MINFVVYEIATGRIVQAGQMGTLSYSATVSQLLPGKASATSETLVNIDDHYVSGGEVTPKQPLNFPNQTITADGIDEAVIAGIPAGVSVTWPDGQTDEVTDGEVSFAVDLPGTYVLRFTGVPYLDTEVTIEAVPAA